MPTGSFSYSCMSGGKTIEGTKTALLKKTNIAPGVYVAKLSDSESVLLLAAAELPTPDRTMFANWVGAKRLESEIELAFGQHASASDTLSAALFVSISPANMAKALYGGGNERFLEGLSRRVAQPTLEPVPMPKLPQQGERMAFHRASIVNMSYADRDAEIRFYHVSPRAVHDARTGDIKKTGKGVVSTLVRIDLSIENLELLTRMLTQLVAKDELPFDPLEGEDQ